MTRECECYGTIHDPVRRERLKEVYPDGRVPIQYPWLAGTATTGQETYEFYSVDKSRLSKEQVKGLAKALSPVFKLSESEIIADFDNPEMEIPLKAEGVTTEWCRRHFMAVALSD